MPSIALHNVPLRLLAQIDVEGSEWEPLEQMMESGVLAQVGQVRKFLYLEVIP